MTICLVRVELDAEVAEGSHIPKHGTLLILPFSGQELVADVEVLVPAAVDTAWGEVGDAAHVVKHVDPVVRHHLGCYLDLKGVQKVDPTVC